METLRVVVEVSLSFLMSFGNGTPKVYKAEVGQS